ncbi:hypothetical protein BDZ91DRAFT_783663 [Kalaharituber pfeilii]|nr:hypothetical protein BDZ91DRAFT_783663 [Kalaharituber pfeilii]
MKFTTAFLALAFSAVAVNALVIPAAELNARDIQVADSTLAKREAAAAPAAAPEPAVDSAAPVDDEDLADPEDEAFLRSLADLTEEDGLEYAWWYSRRSITKYLKSKAKTLKQITKADRKWLGGKIKSALKKVLKSIIGSWAAGHDKLQQQSTVQPATAQLYNRKYAQDEG